MPHVKRLVALDKCDQGARRILAEAPDWLTQRERLAAEIFLRDLEQKPEGYGPLDSPD